MKLKKLVFISAVSGVGKSTACEYIKKNNLLKKYEVFDIDDLENINNYNENTYDLFYENAIKKAIILSKDKNIVIGSCINPTDIEKLNIPNEIGSYINILITCSNEELKKRLKAREKNRQCSSDDYIKGQIDYQNYLLNHIGLYQMHIDNSDDVVENISRTIVNFIEKGK
jgi:adenylate kinase